MELLDTFAEHQYPNEIGPGVYDIHSPRIPTGRETKTLLNKASKVIPAQNLWVNPDCGLKTRQWEEVIPALKKMVAVAQESEKTPIRIKKTAKPSLRTKAGECIHKITLQRSSLP